MRRSVVMLSAAGLMLASAGTAFAQNGTPHNIILFVPDGLRGRIVTTETAPAMAAVRDTGVNFRNSHSLFPTFTTANASAMATGHYLGDTGDFSNTIYTGYPVAPAGGTVTPFLEIDPVILDVDEHFGGDYLNEETVLKMARARGFSTAALGKLGPTLIFDHTDKTGADGLHSIVDRRRHRRQERRSAFRRNESRLGQGRPSARHAGARRQRQGRRRHDARHRCTEHRAAGLFRRCRRQGRAADVQGAQQAVRAGVLVARSRRQPAQQWRQPQHRDARHQRPHLARRHQKCRQQSGAAAQGARRSRSRRQYQHHHRFRSRFLDDLKGRARPVPRRKSAIATRRRISCRWAFWPSIWPRRSICRCSIPTTRTRRWPGPPIPRPETAFWDRTRQNPIWWWPPMADRTCSTCRTGTGSWRSAPSRPCWSRTTSADCSSMTSSGAFPARCRCRRSASRARR